ncbi:MAG: hypothetical protein EOM72_09705 [Opitutae bacterium]|nr:hypothetical protein [Opitutae bacterium]
MKKSIILVLLAALMASCATTALWESTDPYVAVKQDEITEDELRAQGRTFERDDLFQLFFVQKRGLPKYKDYALRTIGTPVTLAADAALALALVGAYAGFVYLIAWGGGDPFCAAAAAAQTTASFRDSLPR